MKRLMLALLPSILIASLAFIAPVGAADATVSIVSIAQGFDPKTVNINVGEKVTWTNDDTQLHTVTASNGSFNSGDLSKGQQYEKTFTQAGVFGYICARHPNMTGTVNVQAGGTQPPTSPPATTPPVTTKPSSPPPPTKTGSPSPSPSASKSPTAKPSASPSVSPTESSPTTGPTSTSGPTGTVIAKSADDEKKKDEGGLGVGSIVAIVAVVLAIGSGAGLWYLRKTPA